MSTQHIDPILNVRYYGIDRLRLMNIDSSRNGDFYTMDTDLSDYPMIEYDKFNGSNNSYFGVKHFFVYGSAAYNVDIGKMIYTSEETLNNVVEVLKQCGLEDFSVRDDIFGKSFYHNVQNENIKLYEIIHSDSDEDAKEFTVGRINSDGNFKLSKIETITEDELMEIIDESYYPYEVISHRDRVLIEVVGDWEQIEILTFTENCVGFSCEKGEPIFITGNGSFIYSGDI